MIGIIFNPKAGSGKFVPRMKAFLEMLDAKGVEYDYRETQKAGDTIEFAIDMADKCSTIIPAGGDGTVYEVINPLVDRDVRLSILPYGSGNDAFASVYGFDYSDEKVIESVISGEDVKVDCAKVNDKYTFVILAGLGFAADLLVRFKEKGGSYAKAIPGLMIHCTRKDYKLLINGEEKSYHTEFMSAFNSGFAGGGIKVTDKSSIYDGEMEMVILKKSGRFRRLLNFLALSRKKLEEQPNVDIIKFKECTVIPQGEPLVINMDGELVREDEMNIKVLPGHLRFAAPIKD